jgi:glutamyl-tRNA synthetase
MSNATAPATYRGRLAPSPTGYLHLGHARTFWTAQHRAAEHGGVLILRNEDLDPARCRPELVAAMLEDLRWFGLRWSEGPDVGGPFAPYNQSERMPHYAAAFERLRETGFIFPCTCSRQDVQRALSAPHEGNDEPVYPGTCRPRVARRSDAARRGLNWRFRVCHDERISFIDRAFGSQSRIAGRDFGDFLIWRKDDLPSYQLAVAVDDAAMKITEVVRGADLITSTFRQLLIYRALGLDAPAFHHCPLVIDESGDRLAKRSGANSLRALRAAGAMPEALQKSWSAH